MADKEVRIDFTTKGDTKGAKKVEKEIKEVNKATKQQGRDTVQSGRVSEDALERVEMTARDLRQELDKIDGLDPKVRKQIEGVADSMDRAAVSGKKMAAAQGSAGKSSRKSGLAVLEFSRAVEDAQYGIRGVLNNIPTLVMMLGGGGGLAGVISLAAVGLTQLFERLGKNEEKADETKEAFEDLVNQMAKVKDEANKADYSAFLNSLDRAKDKLDLQNAELKANISLLTLQRNMMKEVSEVEDQLRRTEIDIRRATDPNFSEEDAALERAKLDLQKLAREEAAKEADLRERARAAQQKVVEAKQEEQLEQDRLLKLKEDEVELEERLEDLKSKRAFRAGLEGQLETAREQREGIFRDPRQAPRTPDELATFRDEIDQKIADLVVEIGKTGKLERIESDIQAAEQALKRTNTRIRGSRGELENLAAGIDVLEVEAASQQEQTEFSIEQIKKITDLKEQDLIKQTELQTTIKGANDLFAQSVLPALEGEIERSGVILDEGAKRAKSKIEELAQNQIADLNETEQVIAALKVLQSRGIDLQGRVLTILESESRERQGLENRVRQLEQRINQNSGRR